MRKHWKMTDYEEIANPGEIVDAHNVLRIAHGLEPLAFNPILQRVSLEWALRMSETGVCDHGHGPTMFDRRIRDAGYQGDYVRENAAVGQRSLAEAMSDWMNSPGHRDSILDERCTEIGCSGVKLDDGAFAWCTDFGRPKDAEQGMA
jgi:uncharacterized protein YkwD